ncbi:hypothetical protein [Devosia sp.]|uniref:hypothetical protein n=1 Tax=Devosia sp. TaxID=1871048 RepID=UPI003265157A
MTASPKPQVSLLVHLLNEAMAMERIASIASNQLEGDFSISRAAKVDGSMLTFHFQEEGVLDTLFLIEELRTRSIAIRERIAELESAQ